METSTTVVQLSHSLPPTYGQDEGGTGRETDVVTDTGVGTCYRRGFHLGGSKGESDVGTPTLPPRRTEEGTRRRDPFPY